MLTSAALTACYFALSLPSNFRNLLVTSVDPRTTEGKVTNIAVAVTNQNDRDSMVVDYYKQYNGNGSLAAGWPPMTNWVSFMDMSVSSCCP